jgi:DNA polymerase II small subunit/DNA polymerase delta subunit B
MDREAVVRELTKKGIIVTPEMLEEPGLAIVQKQTGQIPVSRKPPKTKLSVKVARPERLPRMSVDDFASYYNSRYSGLRDILLKKTPAVSINKARESFSEVSVIGMVKERNSQGFVLEDTTGEIPVMSNDEVREDDVVGVKGAIREGRLFQKELVWPDIPTDNQTRSVPGMVLLLSTFLDENIRKASQDFSLMFIPERPGTELTEEEDRKLITALPNPSPVSVNKKGTTFNLLIYNPGRPVPKQEVLEMLKRRHLSPDKREISTTTDPYLIEPVPDLFWIISGERHTERYRGVTVITTGKRDAVKYDAETGEAFFAYDSQPSQASPD